MRMPLAIVCLAGICLSCALPRNVVAGQSQATFSGQRGATRRHLPLTKFYGTADPLPRGESGDLIRSAESEEYNLPGDVNAVRILYHSRSAGGNDVATSGVVLYPDKKPPTGGWPIIAWAHSWVGAARDCAQSLDRDLQHGPFLTMYVHLGYAVVATDYTGLGAGLRSAFADTSSNALDVIYSVPAARRAVPQLGIRWIAMGTSEGGTAAASVAEIESDMRDPHYLGSVVISHLADPEVLYASAGGEAPILLAYGIKTAYPQFNADQILTPEAIPFYQQLAKKCDQSEVRGKPAMLKPGWQQNEFVQRYFVRNRLGLKSAKSPLLVIASANDPAVDQTDKILSRMCKQGDRIQFEKYANSDSGRVIGDSARDQMAWIESRFAGGTMPSNCSSRHN